MTGRVARGKALPPAVVEQVVAKTDGVPLFVEELTKMVLESDLLQEREERYELTGPLPPLAIPATLHDSLMARLDRLAAVKGMAQLGATLGREFSYELLQAISPWDEDILQRGLQQLVTAEFLYQQGLPPQAMYLFKHALIQEAAYQSLLRSTRQQYHQHIAQVLEARFPAICETRPELLAHYYTEAGVMTQAIPYWQRAGQRALERSAHVEAVSHLTKGLEVLRAVPDTIDRTQQELDLQTILGSALLAAKGYAAPDVERVYARARELCQRMGETLQLVPVLQGLWLFYLNRGELQMARELGEQLLRLTQGAQDPMLRLAAHGALGTTLFWLGELALARKHLEQSIALYDLRQDRSLALRYGHDPGVMHRSYASYVLWWLGYPSQALQRSDEMRMLAQELAHPLSGAYALGTASALHQLRREAQAAQERAEAAMALSREQGFPYWLGIGTIRRGWALATQEQGAEGVKQIRQGLALWRATGADLNRPWFLALLAEACGRAGEVEKALTALAEALATVDTTANRVCEAELYRLKGELLLARAAVHDAEAETCFRQALAIARHQQAKSLELRAAMSLCRLWQQQGKRDAARELLAPVYGWFTEGFDTADLQEAKVLLAALS
jgi:predicted ATPase